MFRGTADGKTSTQVSIPFSDVQGPKILIDAGLGLRGLFWDGMGVEVSQHIGASEVNKRTIVTKVVVGCMSPVKSALLLILLTTAIYHQTSYEGNAVVFYGRVGECRPRFEQIGIVFSKNIKKIAFAFIKKPQDGRTGVISQQF